MAPKWIGVGRQTAWGKGHVESHLRYNRRMKRNSIEDPMADVPMGHWVALTVDGKKVLASDTTPAKVFEKMSGRKEEWGLSRRIDLRRVVFAGF